MPFTPKIIIEDDLRIRWEYGIEIGGRHEILAQSITVPAQINRGMAASTWRNFFSGKAEPISDTNELKHANAFVLVIVDKLEDLMQSPDQSVRIALSQIFQDGPLKDIDYNFLISAPVVERMVVKTAMNGTADPADQAALHLNIFKAISTELKQANAFVLDIVDKLEELLQSPDQSVRIALSQIFQDGALKEIRYNHLISDPVVEKMAGKTAMIGTADPADQAALYLIIFKAISTFLRRDERYITLDASLAYLYAVWQWYNLAKYLSMLVTDDYNTVKGNISKNALSSHPYLILTREMAEAHHVLAEILQNPPGFDEAIAWLADWRKIDTNQISTSLLREQMRLSLPLIPKEWKKASIVSRGDGSDGVNQAGECAKEWKEASIVSRGVDCVIPLEAPGWNGTGSMPGGWLGRLKYSLYFFPEARPHWNDTKLHPVFESERNQETTGKQVLRGMVADWLLARYDIDDALWLSRLMIDKPWKATVPKWTAGLGLFIIFAIFFWPAILGLTPMMQLVGQGLQIILFIGLGVLVYNNVEPSTIPYLILPRIAGGVAVGYIVLILSEDSIKMQRFFLQDGGGWPVLRIAFLWLAVLTLGFLYLRFDAMPFVGTGQPGIATRRAMQVLIIALADSIIMGMIFLAIASQMYQYDDLLQRAGLRLLGPMGLIDFNTFFIQVPFALLTGLVTQFIFEEKTVTTSVWAPEVE